MMTPEQEGAVGEMVGRTFEEVLRSSRSAGVEWTGDDLMALTGRQLDRLLGPLETVIHQAGPTIEGGQLCTRCGAVLQDLYGKHVAVEDDDAWALRHDNGWPEGQLVWELWRWGRPTAFPHALGSCPSEAEGPDPAQGERWCGS